MGVDLNQLKTEIIEPTLRKLEMYSPQAVNLLLGTAAQESAFGKYYRQKGSGPALGIYQIEPDTHDSIVDNFIAYRIELIGKIQDMGYADFDAARLKYDVQYATIFARLKYWPIPYAIPNDVSGLADYWKTHYNTINGRGKESEFIDNYHKYVKK